MLYGENSNGETKKESQNSIAFSNPFYYIGLCPDFHYSTK